MNLKSGNQVELINGDHLYGGIYKYGMVYMVEVDTEGPFIFNENLDKDYDFREAIKNNPQNWSVK